VFIGRGAGGGEGVEAGGAEELVVGIGEGGAGGDGVAEGADVGTFSAGHVTTEGSRLPESSSTSATRYGLAAVGLASGLVLGAGAMVGCT
jgi:hypothetical protein